MPTGEVDTSAITSAIIESGTQLPFRFNSPLLLCLLSLSFGSLSKLTHRKESVRAKG